MQIQLSGAFADSSVVERLGNPSHHQAEKGQRMNPIRNAAIAIHDAEDKHPGLVIRMDVSCKYVHLGNYILDVGDDSSYAPRCNGGAS